MANTYESIATVTVGSGGAANMDFSSIPQTYTDLILQVSTRDDRATVQDNEFYLKFNNNTSGYSSRVLYTGGTSVASFSNSNYPPGLSNSAGSTASVFSSSTFYIPNYTGSQYKSVSIDSVDEGNVSTGQYIYIASSLWSNTSAINQITITPYIGSFVQYTTATLYGIKNS